MFLKNSRYYGIEQITVGDGKGGTTRAVKLRRLPEVSGETFTVQGNDRLDVIARRKYGDPTLFWHVADANTELEAPRLTETAGDLIIIPEQ